MSGRCFRLVSGGEGGGPTHCPEPPVWRGTFRAPTAAATPSRPAKATGHPRRGNRIQTCHLWQGITFWRFADDRRLD
jgi:hypothetical protein